MSSCFSGACAFARLWERWSLLGHSPPGIYGYFCSGLFSRICLQVLDPQQVWCASPACVDKHRKDNQVRINRGDKVMTHPGTTRAPWLLAPWSSRSSRWSAWCCNTFRTNSRKKALTILSLRCNFNSNRLSAWFSFRQSCASANAVSGAWKSLWSSSTGLFLNERLLVHQIFQECLHFDRLSRNQFLSVRKAGFWFDIQKYGEQPAENFKITFDNCLPRYGWQFLTRWPTSCSSLGNSLSPLSSPLFPSTGSLEASMSR